MPHPLDPLVVSDPEGHPVRMGTLWADRTTVLVFIRHFGCLFSRQQLGQLQTSLDQIRALGANLVVIGQGTAGQARDFREREQLKVPLFTDPTRQAYCALEMRRDRRSVFSLRTLGHAARAWLQGFRQTAVAGDPFQQGGAIVVDPSGVERYRYISREAGDHPPTEAILDALR